MQHNSENSEAVVPFTFGALDGSNISRPRSPRPKPNWQSKPPSTTSAMRWRRGHLSFRKTKGKNASRPETEDLNTRTISLDDLKRLRTIRALLASSSPIRLETEESTASLLQEMAVIFARVNAGHEGANLPMEESKPMSVICDEDAAGQSSGKTSAVVSTRSGSKDNVDSLLNIPPTAWGHALEYL